MLCSLTPVIVAMATPSFRITGAGPPVVFHTGMYNTLPHFVYSRLLREMGKSVSVITTKESPIDATTIDDIADAIGADTIGLVTHSGLLPTVLESPRVQRAVLIDPFTFPDLSLTDGIRSTRVSTAVPTRIIRGGWSFPSVPKSFRIVVENADEIVHNEAGPTDLFDNLYAGIAERMGARTERNSKDLQSFQEWTSTPSVIPGQERDQYRMDIVHECVDFLLDRTRVLASIQ